VYAPQLAIPGFGGPFESVFEEALTLDHKGDYAGFRDPSRMVSPSQLVCDFVQGPLMGPECRYFETFDYLVWMLSDASAWMPSELRQALLVGMAEWHTWPWWHGHDPSLKTLGYEPDDATGMLADVMDAVAELGTFSDATDLLENNPSALRDLRHRLAFSVVILHLPETVDVLAQRFLDRPFIDRYVQSPANRHRDESGVDTR
jgi:hypothetical protein